MRTAACRGMRCCATRWQMRWTMGGGMGAWVGPWGCSARGAGPASKLPRSPCGPRHVSVMAHSRSVLVIQQQPRAVSALPIGLYRRICDFAAPMPALTERVYQLAH